MGSALDQDSIIDKFGGAGGAAGAGISIITFVVPADAVLGSILGAMGSL